MIVENILPIWQPIGYSTHLITQRVGELYGVSTSHTGTLDPMAEGVVIVLLGEERLKKQKHAAWAKGYEFEVALGISTDTYDGMGIITTFDLKDSYLEDIPKEEFQKITQSFIGNYTQKIPPYSTKKIKGQHLHQITRSNRKVSLPTKKGEIYELDYLEAKVIKISDLIQNISDRILLVTGDFRQQEIINNWKKVTKDNADKDVKVLKFYVEMTKGLYVRSLSQDICKRIGANGFTHSIKRAKNGFFNQNNTKTLEEIFGNDFKKKLDFVSRPNLR